MQKKKHQISITWLAITVIVMYEQQYFRRHLLNAESESYLLMVRQVNIYRRDLGSDPSRIPIRCSHQMWDRLSDTSPVQPCSNPIVTIVVQSLCQHFPIFLWCKESINCELKGNDKPSRVKIELFSTWNQWDLQRKTPLNFSGDHHPAVPLLSR